MNHAGADEGATKDRSADPDDLFTTEIEGLPEASPTRVIRCNDGDRLDLRITPVRKRIDDAELRMLGYNGSIPGPTLHVDQGSEITVQVTNDGDVEATVHWHGLRLENRYDGVPHETQAPIPIGGTFTYKVQFPDAGFYWYHPHIREDFGLEMGLYGTIIVEPSDPVVLAGGRPPAQHHAGRPPRRGRPHRPLPPLRSELHGDGAVRERDADQRRDHVLGRGGRGRGRSPLSREHREHTDLQRRAPGRPDEAGRWGQRSVRARGLRRRGDARPLGACRRRRDVRRSGGRAARTSHAGSGLRPRCVLGRRERNRFGRWRRSTCCASIPS